MIELNYVHILVATIAAYFVGWMWHGPVFGKKWMALEGFTPESMKAMKMTPGTAMSLGFVMTFLTAWVLAWIYAVTPFALVGVFGALQLAFWPWLGFTMPTLAGKWLWEGRSFKLFAFNALHGFVALFAMALVLVFWV
jgi:hypothetical protein